MAKESGIAKSIGDQKEEDMQFPDLLLLNFLSTGKKIFLRLRPITKNDDKNTAVSVEKKNNYPVTNVNSTFLQRSYAILSRDQSTMRKEYQKNSLREDTECYQEIFSGIMSIVRVKN